MDGIKARQSAKCRNHVISTQYYFTSCLLDNVKKRYLFYTYT